MRKQRSAPELSGHTFGRLTVQMRVVSDAKGAHWQCRCECGVEGVYPANRLRMDKVKSCGCLRTEKLVERRLDDLTGARFGWLVVSSRAESSAAGEARWNCVCDCGGTSISWGRSLKRGLKTSCGCRAAETRELRLEYLAAMKRIEQQVALLANGKCPYCAGETSPESVICISCGG